MEIIKEKNDKNSLPLIKSEDFCTCSARKMKKLTSEKTFSTRRKEKIFDTSQKNKLLFSQRKIITGKKLFLTVQKKVNNLRYNKDLEVSKSNDLKKEKEKKEKSNILYYKIYQIGNDPTTIQKCFEHRINWKSENKREDADDKGY